VTIALEFCLRFVCAPPFTLQTQSINPLYVVGSFPVKNLYIVCVRVCVSECILIECEFLRRQMALILTKSFLLFFPNAALMARLLGFGKLSLTKASISHICCLIQFGFFLSCFVVTMKIYQQDPSKLLFIVVPQRTPCFSSLYYNF
jgi:uncharacterized membrane protein YtjA (UPF0391 family)